jgi:acyl-CoA thioesterase
MASFDEVMAGVRADGEGWVATPTDDWLQGRTLYGGLSAALALRACELAVPGLPPLRAGQVAFIGPAAGEVRMAPRVVRQGKSVTFMGCDLLSGGAVALRALFAFGGARESAYAAVAPPPPLFRPPGDCPPLWPGSGVGPSFAQHLNQRLAGELRPLSGADRGDLLVWVKHAEPVTPGQVALVAMGDALPPASFSRFNGPAMISTMTWSFDLFDPGHADGSGWLLLHSRDDGVGEGYAGQDMGMWDETGRPLMRGRQSVAVFG